MKKLQLSFLLLLCYQIFLVTARSQPIKICITNGFEKQCDQLARETQEVQCVRVQDSIECAKILSKSSGFGIFSAESMLLLAALKYDGLTVLKELKHRDRLNQTSDFDSVVIVKASHTGGLKGLKGLNYCHPGLYYDHAERWTERFLKHFERIVTTPDCEKASSESLSPAEIEVSALADFFGSGCRPGAWSNDPTEDQKLKSKYPQFCELCTSKTSSCAYANTNRHIEALQCLTHKGQVAYVSLQDAQDFFSSSENAQLRSEYAYLCDDGTLQIMNDNPNAKPCTWLRQPWPAIVASVYNAIELSNSLNRWAYSSYNWENAVKEILTADSLTIQPTTIQEPRSVFGPYREVPFSLPLCSTSATWCTKSQEEKEKCEVIRTAGITSGVYPLIECQEPVMGSIGCLKEVNEGRADFTVIDSNLGYLARHQYNLTTALYGETEKYASAGVVVRANSTFKNFDDLRGVKACVAEFNGFASVSFINNGKKMGFLPKNCNHSQILSDFFGSSCMPGATDPGHSMDDMRDNLCSLCPRTSSGGISAVPLATREDIPADAVPLDQEVSPTGTSLQNELDVLNSKINCNADAYNRFYGNKGALNCLLNRGEVAILALQDLPEHARDLTIDPNYYQVICRNGTRADRTGFEVDPDCALVTYIDSEVVIKPQNIKREGIINALLSFDQYFKSDPDVKIYGTFDGLKNVLFKNGTVGLAAYNEKDLGAAVDNYNNLFKEIEACGNAFTAIPFASIIYATMLLTIAVNRLRQ